MVESQRNRGRRRRLSYDDIPCASHPSVRKNNHAYFRRTDGRRRIGGLQSSAVRKNLYDIPADACCKLDNGILHGPQALRYPASHQRHFVHLEETVVAASSTADIRFSPAAHLRPERSQEPHPERLDSRRRHRGRFAGLSGRYARIRRTCQGYIQLVEVHARHASRETGIGRNSGRDSTARN